jgi:uncharacterized membrane protein
MTINISKKAFYPLLLLIIPFVGMFVSDQVNWSPFDFLVMGLLLFSLGLAADAIFRKFKQLRSRLLFTALLLVVFLLIWIELAVGLFGTPLAGS